MTYYYIYKITNKINHKIYYGQHTTSNLNDGYMGSGTALKLAIKKYGLENFEKKILKFYNSPEELNIVEARLVNEKWLKKNKNRTYNLLTGGNHRILSDESRQKISESAKKRLSDKTNHPMYGKHTTPWNKGKTGLLIPWNKGKKGLQVAWNKGKTHSEETCRKISESCKGKHWYNNGKTEVQAFECPDGFVKGRLLT